MDIIKAGHLAIDFMSKHGLIQRGWRFEFNNRKRSLGLCNETTKTIFLSRIFVRQLPESKVVDTILHEIAHALVGCRHGHNSIWKRKALEIGCNGNRCATHAETKDVVIEGKYKAKCKHCAKVYYSHRKRKRKSSCPCHGRGVYLESHRLDFVQQY